MLLKTHGTRRKFSISLGFFATAIFMLVLFHESDHFIDAKEYVGLAKVSSPAVASKNQKVLLPSGFQFEETTLRDHLAGTSSKKWETLQLNDSERMEIPPHAPGKFTKTGSLLFSSSQDPECFLKEKKIKLAIDKSEQVPLNLELTLAIFLQEAKVYGDSYNQHLLPYLEGYMDKEKVQKNWFRFSGSSVWLKDYNVHYVVSRLIVTKTGDRKSPIVSLVLAQIFDEQWNEIEDVRLVFPTNSVENTPGFKVGSDDFLSYRFPRILPIPFALEEVGKFWGTEDPRVTLVKNKNGHEEPIVVFNAYHIRDVAESEESEESEDSEKSERSEKSGKSDKSDKFEKPEKPKKSGARSIFLSFPFQLQKGKQIEGAETDVTAENWFTRTKQIKIEGETERKVEKNWTPFVSSAGEFHEHVMFATMLDPLKIIKCDLWNAENECVVQESTDDDSVSALRGGTPLLSVKLMEEEDKEYFVGVARAHLTDCGCGRHFYRPNLVVVARVGNRWSVTHTSSTIDLGIEPLPWNPGERVCKNGNAVIPNGIGFWDLERDIMGLDFSVNDITVERILLRGVLRALERAKFLESAEERSESPVSCALYASKEYCIRYGIEQAKNRAIEGTFARGARV